MSVASSDELSRSLMFWVFREKVKTLYLETFQYYDTMQNYKKMPYVMF